MSAVTLPYWVVNLYMIPYNVPLYKFNIDIQLRRRRPFVGYFIGIHGESRGLQLTSGTSLYNKQRKDKVRISIVKVTKWRHRLGYGIYANYK